MKKILITGAVLMLLLSLAACGRESYVGRSQNDEGSQPLIGGETGQFETPPIMSLLLGTLWLEDTDLAVNSEMASALLPLWQAARTIYTSDTSASEERDAILDQIREVMTEEQLAAIQDMELGQEDMREAMRELLGDAFPEGTEPGEGFEGFRFGGEGMPPGFQPGQGFGGGPGFGEGISPEARATMQAERGGRLGMGVNPRLFDVLIELLQERVGEG